MRIQKRISTIAGLAMLCIFLITAVAIPFAHAASVTINHYENHKVLGTHIVSAAWYHFAISSGYWGERMDELYHFCMEEEHQNDPRCRHML